MHRAARDGYREAGRYERSRPDYPAEAIEWLAEVLGLGSRSLVVEIGAGTGKLTRKIAPRCRAVVAVEPLAEMRRELALRLPTARVVAGLAEALPLRAGSATAVICAQAFHWFANPDALGEIHRVLTPGGRLGLVWNQRDESVEWVRRIGDILETIEGDAPRYRSGRWRDVLRSEALFGSPRLADFGTEQVGSAEMVVDRIASTSLVARLPRERRDEILAEVRRLARGAGRDAAVHLPYVTHAFCFDRR